MLLATAVGPVFLIVAIGNDIFYVPYLYMAVHGGVCPERKLVCPERKWVCPHRNPRKSDTN
jgi:hypothetical protein